MTYAYGILKSGCVGQYEEVGDHGALITEKQIVRMWTRQNFSQIKSKGGR
jgi:hypothetical protein